MDEEIKTIMKNNTQELTSLPKSHNTISVKWVYKTKKMPKEKLKGTKQGYLQKVIVKKLN